MKITMKKDVPVATTLKIALLVDGDELYYSHLDGNLKCSACGWGVGLHRNWGEGKEAHFEHKDGNPKMCAGPM